MTPDYQEKSALAYQLDSNNINWDNPVDSAQFYMPDKIKYILNSLYKCDTYYALVMDGGDTCICKDIDNGFIEKYKSLNKDVVFNATSKRFPNVKVEPLGLFFNEGKKSFLNAGVCFGKVDALIEVYELANKLVKEIPNPYGSEQFIIRHCRVRMLDKIGVDSDCLLFRVAHSGELGMEE